MDSWTTSPDFSLLKAQPVLSHLLRHYSMLNWHLNMWRVSQILGHLSVISEYYENFREIPLPRAAASSRLSPGVLVPLSLTILAMTSSASSPRPRTSSHRGDSGTRPGTRTRPASRRLGREMASWGRRSVTYSA